MGSRFSEVLAADVGVRKRRKTTEDADTVRCQFCMKCISRTGKISNQLAHLTRHAKLHASKKQYSCGLCGAQYSRRYLTAAHMKEMHQEEGEVMNHAVEMKEEYTALLEACFPGALAARHGMHSEGYEFDETALFEREDE